MKLTFVIASVLALSACGAMGAAANKPKPSPVPPVKVCTYTCASKDLYGNPVDHKKFPPIHVWGGVKCTYIATYGYKPAPYTCTYDTKTGALIGGSSTCTRKGDVDECHTGKPPYYKKRDAIPVRPVAGAVPIARGN